jgi:hypothetical protein
VNEKSTLGSLCRRLLLPTSLYIPIIIILGSRSLVGGERELDVNIQKMIIHQFKNNLINGKGI